MWIKVRKAGQGAHHSEIVVEVKTADGIERLVIDGRSIRNNQIEVGNPLAFRARGQALIELPRETMSGAARVWVKEDSLLEKDGEARAA